MFKKKEHGNQINPLRNGFSNDFKILKGEAELDRLRVEDIVEIPLGYGHRGRPRKDARPMMKTEYKVNIELAFDGRGPSPSPRTAG